MADEPYVPPFPPENVVETPPEPPAEEPKPELVVPSDEVKVYEIIPEVDPKVAARLAAAKELRDTRIKELQEEISYCVAEHKGLEGNIPLNHQYWAWQNELRGLMQQG